MSAEPEALRADLCHDLVALNVGPADEHARMIVLGRVGEAHRMLGEFESALPYLEQALAISRRLGDGPAETAGLIRLATAGQYRGDHARVEAMFRRALALSGRPGCERYRDFALQHLGKCLVEMARMAEAIALFQEALSLRREKGDAGLIASTEEAIEGARARAATLGNAAV